MTQKPVLVIMAAGLGSRYGSMKQIDGIGPHNEPIIEYSMYDAKKAGFAKVVLIIRKEHEPLFHEALTDRVGKHIPISFAYQDINNIPEPFQVPEGRTKPWGTTQAMLACKGIVDGPFAIINADDFYGRHAYEIMYNYLAHEVSDDHYAMVGYPCQNTLTDNGTVTRGVCETNENKELTHIVEIQKISRAQDGTALIEENGEQKPLSPDTLVSMNFWGFTPKIFSECEPVFKQFLADKLAENPLKCEHVIPTAMGQLIAENTCSVKVLATPDPWFGVTYKEDKPIVQAKLRALIDAGVYPEDLWSKDND